MCTVTVITLPGDVAGGRVGTGSFRVVVNRDEQHTRPAALHPRWRRVATTNGSMRAIWPIDPLGGGTWVGATEQGVVLALLNLNPTPAPTLPEGLQSRGSVIPRLIGLGRGEAIMEGVRAMDLTRYAPFRLVVAEHAGREGCIVRKVTWDRETLRVREGIAAPACFVSSGLGDALVACRHDLFDELVRASPTREAQDRFHTHVWDGREHLSVLMCRDDARTVSVTRVEVGPAESGSSRVRMGYRPVEVALGALSRVRSETRIGVGAGV